MNLLMMNQENGIQTTKEKGKSQENQGNQGGILPKNSTGMHSLVQDIHN